jgi:exonuclease III
MRGWGDSAKRRRLQSLIKSGAFEVCLLQETKRTSFEDYMIHNLWGHKDVAWVVKESCGLSGGLLIMWNKDLFTLRHSFTGDGFLGICVEWMAGLLYIVNIYSSCLLSGKKKLWADLLDFKSNNDQGEWCLGGDFNSVSTVGERKGRHGTGGQTERSEFCSFIDALEVVDIPVTGKKFSWFSPDGLAMSRLDRFLLSEGFIEKGGISNQRIGDRDISDHCPVWLECSTLNWGPKPFKFLNCWLQHPEFISFVKDNWDSAIIRGNSAFILKEKLNRLKEALKNWNREVFGIVDLNIEKTVKELNDMEDQIANDVLDPNQLNSKDLVK